MTERWFFPIATKMYFQFFRIHPLLMRSVLIFWTGSMRIGLKQNPFEMLRCKHILPWIGLPSSVIPFTIPCVSIREFSVFAAVTSLIKVVLTAIQSVFPQPMILLPAKFFHWMIFWVIPALQNNWFRQFLMLWVRFLTPFTRSTTQWFLIVSPAITSGVIILIRKTGISQIQVCVFTSPPMILHPISWVR